jgi:hypothetical protein
MLISSAVKFFQIRKWIESEGYIVEDTPQGSKVKKA